MADNSTLPATGDVVAADDISGVKHQRVKLEWGADGTVNEVDDASGKRVPVLALDTKIVDITITRPADTNVYAAGDTIADSTSTPTAFNATGFARANGGSGKITNITIIDSVVAGTPANLELWIFDASYTNNNDNAAWSPSDANANNVIGVIQFGANPIGGVNNAIYVAQGLDIPYVCLTTTTLWFALVVRNAYTPTSAEVFKIRVGVERYG